MDGFGNAALSGVKRFYFIGIYGVSVSSLAIICARRGYTVSGSDTGEGTEERRRGLENAKITVRRGNSPQNLPSEASPSEVAVVYTAAITEDNAELSEARRRGMRIYSRAELMELITGDIPLRIGIAGTHGKSTVCGMVSEIFLAAGLDPDVLCGAELPSVGGAFRIGSGERVIYEACEYKNFFLRLRPSCAVVTNIEEDHLDFFKDIGEIRESFFTYADGSEVAVIGIDGADGRIIAERLKGRCAPDGESEGNHDAVPWACETEVNSVRRDEENEGGVAEADGVRRMEGETGSGLRVTASVGKRIVTCSAADHSADYYARGVTVENGRYSFDICRRGEYVCRVALRVVGAHNLQNAITAAATALENGVSPCFVAKGLSDFTGVRRRMEYRGSLNGAVIYDDYAHHPTEIRATLAAARAMGFRFICCAFQPHTFSRTAKLFCDFVTAFADADEVVFADVYAAREKNTYGVTSRELATATKNGYYLPTPELIAQHFRNIAAPGVLLLTMGAGELDRVADMI